jgi:hypothetical protein
MKSGAAVARSVNIQPLRRYSKNRVEMRMGRQEKVAFVDVSLLPWSERPTLCIPTTTGCALLTAFVCVNTGDSAVPSACDRHGRLTDCTLGHWKATHAGCMQSRGR